MFVLVELRRDPTKKNTACWKGVFFLLTFGDPAAVLVAKYLAPNASCRHQPATPHHATAMLVLHVVEGEKPWCCGKGLTCGQAVSEGMSSDEGWRVGRGSSLKRPLFAPVFWVKKKRRGPHCQNVLCVDERKVGYCLFSVGPLHVEQQCPSRHGSKCFAITSSKCENSTETRLSPRQQQQQQQQQHHHHHHQQQQQQQQPQQSQPRPQPQQLQKQQPRQQQQ